MMKRKDSIVVHLSVLISASLPHVAFAGDGVNEINQTCAVQTGCFAGDNAGFPVTIDTGPTRSFRLTSDLVVPDEHTTAIRVVTSGVSLDLGGFEIRGPNTCAGAPLECALSGSGFGIEIAGDRVQISNGSVTGMGSVGVYGSTGAAHILRDLRVSNNRFQGIRTDGVDAVVRDCTVVQNGEIGVYVAGGGTSMVTDNVSSHNGGNGIQVETRAFVSGNLSSDNGGDGIKTIGVGGSVVNNSMLRNDLGGLNVLFSTTYRDNSILFNAGVPISGPLVNAGGNVCNSSLCP